MRSLTFDYVIVGGGAAGCVIAARLAAESGGTVALLERGRKDTNRWIHIPATFFKALGSKDADAVVSEPDASLNNRPYGVPQGRVLGGGSSVNGMIYMRGQHRDYDDWAQVHGCAGWAFKDVLPVFKRQEANTTLGGAYHGQTGKLVVADATPRHPLCGTILDAAIAAGIGVNDDFNGADQQGTGWYQVTAHKGQRQSSATCFLKPEQHRETLTVLTNVSARKIVTQNRRATAVQARDGTGAEILITATREIVLTAGAFHSPKLLMLSGIGPQDELRRHGIDVVHISEDVGRNYQDHTGAPVTFHLKDNIGLHGADRGLSALRHGLDHFVFGRGLLQSNLLQAGACVDTTGDGRADVQYNFSPFAPGPPGAPPLDLHGIQIHPMTMRPASRGRLGLRSLDPDAAPKLQANVLADESDLDCLRRGIRLAQDIASQAPLAELLAGEIWPGPEVSTGEGSSTLDDAIRAQTRTIFHPSGTCRMGPAPDAVVDLSLRVNGVTGLRVADCSVMPALVSGNTNAPTMMIADRAADAILAER